MCLFPQNAELNEFGLLKFTPEGSLRIPCGKCHECITKRSQEWALRARHEISLHQESSFINLTYNDENVPSIHNIKTEFQKFIKRLRKQIKKPIRYLASHEFGTTKLRPHHHVIIFGWSPPNQYKWRNSKSGNPLYRSDMLEKIWTAGNCEIGEANEKTAYYIASYSLKGNRHTLTDPHTGEIVSIADSMTCSKRPAIGYNYFVANHQQLIDTDSILPRYYFKKLQDINPTLHEHYENKRLTTFKARSSHELYAKHIIDQQKISHRKGELRETEPRKAQESAHHEDQLRNNRDEFHRQQQEKKK